MTSGVRIGKEKYDFYNFKVIRKSKRKKRVIVLKERKVKFEIHVQE